MKKMKIVKMVMKIPKKKMKMIVKEVAIGDENQSIKVKRVEMQRINIIIYIIVLMTIIIQ